MTSTVATCLSLSYSSLAMCYKRLARPHDQCRLCRAGRFFSPSWVAGWLLFELGDWGLPFTLLFDYPSCWSQSNKICSLMHLPRQISCLSWSLSQDALSICSFWSTFQWFSMHMSAATGFQDAFPRTGTTSIDKLGCNEFQPGLGVSSANLIHPGTSNNFMCVWSKLQIEVSWNRDTPKSSILVECFILSQPIWGTPIHENSQIGPFLQGFQTYQLSSWTPPAERKKRCAQCPWEVYGRCNVPEPKHTKKQISRRYNQRCGCVYCVFISCISLHMHMVSESAWNVGAWFAGLRIVYIYIYICVIIYISVDRVQSIDVIATYICHKPW